MTNLKIVKLQEVADSAIEFREAQEATDEARERWLDRIKEAKDAGATQQEIAENCPTDFGSGHLSRQRIAQFLKERP